MILGATVLAQIAFGGIAGGMSMSHAELSASIQIQSQIDAGITVSGFEHSIGESVFASMGIVDAPESFILAANNKRGTLAAAIDANDLTIAINESIASWPDSGALTLDVIAGVTDSSNEIVYYNGKAGQTITLQDRGRDGTTAKAFAAGSRVCISPIAETHNLLARTLVDVEETVFAHATELDGVLVAITDLESDVTAIEAGLDAKLPLAGGTLTGALTLASAPTLDLHAATKRYVDYMSPTSYNAKLYGLAGNGTTDDTAALQALINQLSAIGGGSIYFPPGRYLIGGPLQEPAGRNAQILLPIVPISSNPVTIELFGALPPPTQTHFNSPNPPATAYSIIKSTLTGGTGNASFIAGKEATGAGNYWDNVQLVVRDLIFEAPPNPTFTMLNCYNLMGPRLSNLLIYANSFNLWETVEPTHSNSYAIKMAPSLHSSHQEAYNIDVFGFYNGFLDGELVEAHITLWLCKVGVMEAFNHHPSTFRNLGLQGCVIGIKAAGPNSGYGGSDDGTHYLRVGLAFIEVNQPTGAWNDKLYDIDDPLNLLKGDMKWINIVAGIGNDHKLIKNGGKGLITTEIGASPSAFVRTKTREYDARDYLAGDGVTDDSAAFQALLNQVETDEQNATIWLDDATYVIGGPLQDTSRRNAQLLLPQGSSATGQQYSLKITGVHPPTFGAGGNVGVIPLPMRSTIIKSTLTTASGTDPSMICGRGPTGGGFDEVAGLCVEFANLTIQTAPNPPYTALNMRRVVACHLHNVAVVAGTYMSAPEITPPSTTTSYGIILPDFNKSILCKLTGNVNVLGFYTGIRMGELTHAENIGTWMCIKGLEFGFAYHAALIQRLLVFWCHAGAAWSGIHPVQIIQWDNEHTEAGETAWYKTTYDVYDPSNLGDGDITWITVQAAVGRVPTFVVNGGTGLKIRELGT